MDNLTLVYTYYRNPGMLALHYETWADYPQHLKDRIEVIIVDDCSPEPAADVPRPEGLPEFRIYRIMQDHKWNQHAARNWGAYHAQSEWLLCTDMDHLVPAESLEKILGEGDARYMYKFRRLDAPDLKPHIKRGKEAPHPNSFAMTRQMYWKIGGYDEDFCGIYGTDAQFLSRASERTKMKYLDAYIVRYDRAVQPDASLDVPRKEGRNPGDKKALLKHKERNELPIKLFKDECERVL